MPEEFKEYLDKVAYAALGNKIEETDLKVYPDAIVYTIRKYEKA